jgi:Meckelin (Transmembrane protein 67)
LDEKILMSFSFSKEDKDLSELPFFVAKYNVRGELLSFLPLTNELTLCPFTTRDTQELLRFGNHYKSSCNIDVERIFYEQDEQFIYEIFIKNSVNQ